jgi:hypothetical protein
MNDERPKSTWEKWVEGANADLKRLTDRVNEVTGKSLIRDLADFAEGLAAPHGGRVVLPNVVALTYSEGRVNVFYEAKSVRDVVADLRAIRAFPGAKLTRTPDVTAPAESNRYWSFVVERGTEKVTFDLNVSFPYEGQAAADATVCRLVKVGEKMHTVVEPVYKLVCDGEDVSTLTRSEADEEK